MGWEIERRFLVEGSQEHWASLKGGHHLRQGYLTNTKEPSVRIRLGEQGGALLTTKRGKGIRRTEFESGISKEVANDLMEAAGARILEKIRWTLGPWTLDRFLGSLEGLVLLEIELTSEDQNLPPIPDAVNVIREVTEDNMFTSGALASLPDADRREFVLAAYKGRPE